MQNWTVQIGIGSHWPRSCWNDNIDHDGSNTQLPTISVFTRIKNHSKTVEKWLKRGWPSTLGFSPISLPSFSLKYCHVPGTGDDVEIHLTILIAIDAKPVQPTDVISPPVTTSSHHPATDAFFLIRRHHITMDHNHIHSMIDIHAKCDGIKEGDMSLNDIPTQNHIMSYFMAICQACFSGWYGRNKFLLTRETSSEYLKMYWRKWQQYQNLIIPVQGIWGTW